MSASAEQLDRIFAELSVRTPLALHRADQLHKAKRLWEELHPETRRGGDRKSRAYRAKDQTENISFCSVAAERLGLTDRSIRLDIALVEELGEECVRELWDSSIADNAAALRLLSELETSDRRKLIAALTNVSFREALIKSGIRREINAQEALFQRFVAMWADASPRTKRRIFQHISGSDAAEVA